MFLPNYVLTLVRTVLVMSCITKGVTSVGAPPEVSSRLNKLSIHVCAFKARVYAYGWCGQVCVHLVLKKCMLS